MKKFISENWFKLGILISLIVIIVFTGCIFFWSEIRPSIIKKECTEINPIEQKLIGLGGRLSEGHEAIYIWCLHQKGL